MDEFFSQLAVDDPDVIVKRFLLARKGNCIEAFIMLVASLHWRMEYGLRALMVRGEAGIKENLIVGGKNFFYQTDLDGNLVCYVRTRLHDKYAQTLQEACDYTIYSIELGRKLRSSDLQRVTLVFDMKNAPLAALDTASMSFIANTLQNYYPEILALALIVDAPWIFPGFWRVVRPLLDPVVAGKVIFTTKTDLKKYIAEEKLPKEYGGTDPFEYTYTPCAPGDEEGRVSPDGRPNQERHDKAKADFTRATITATDGLVRSQAKAELMKFSKQFELEAYPPSIYNRMGLYDNVSGSVWK